MTSKKRIFVQLIKWTAGALLALFLILFLTASWLINREPVQKRIRHALERNAETIVKYERLHLALLPRPHVTLSKALVAVPGKLSAVLPEAAIYAEWLPLFSGKIRLAKARLEHPDIAVYLSEKPGVRHDEEGQAPFAETEEFESGMMSVREIAPHLEIVINKGRLVLQRDGAGLSDIRNINGSLALLRKGFDIRLNAETPRWGHVSFKGRLFVRRNTVAVRDLSMAGGNSSLSGLTARFSWKKTPYLSVRSGQGVIDLDDIYERRLLFKKGGNALRDLKKIKGSVRFTEMNFRGPLLHPEHWTMETAGSVEKIIIDGPLLPGPVRISRGEFKATTKTILFKNVKGKILDSSVTATVALGGVFDTIRSVDLFLEGDVGPDTVHWVAKRFNVPPDYILRGPFWVSDLHGEWNKGAMLRLAGTAGLRNGPSVSLDAERTSGGLLIRRLTVQDEKRRATMTAKSTENSLDLTFNGEMSEDTLRRIFERASFDHGWMRGDLRAHVLYNNPRESTAQGFLEAVDMLIPIKSNPLAVKHLTLSANDKKIIVKKGSFIWRDTPFELNGNVSTGWEGFFVDMDVTAESLSMETLRQAFPRDESDTKTSDDGGTEPRKKPERKRSLIQGLIRLSAKNFLIGGYTLKPVRADIFLDRNSTRIHVTETSLCGISLPGHLQPFEKYWLLDIEPSAAGQPLEPALNCLSTNRRITGTYTLTGKLHAKGKGDEMIRSLQGHLEFAAKDGKIYRHPLLGRLFAFLNVTELLRGKLPDLGRDGFAYSSIKIKGDMKNGKLILKEAVVVGKTMNIAGEGEVDFVSNKIDVTLLIAPFKTLEYIISKIPLIRNILSNKLVTIPVRFTGDINDPDVIPLDPQAIGQNLLNIMKGILSLPFKIIDPFIH
jgi:hypothetical protein